MAVYFGGAKGIIFDDFLLLVDCDSDGDGVNNSADIDSDNDGILDSEECLPQLQSLSVGSTLTNPPIDRNLTAYELAAIQSQDGGATFFNADVSFKPTECPTRNVGSGTNRFIVRGYEVDVPECVQSVNIIMDWTIEKKSGRDNSGLDGGLIVIDTESGTVLKSMDKSTIRDTPKNTPETNTYTLNLSTASTVSRLLIIPVLQSQDGGGSHTWLSDITFTTTATSVNDETCYVYSCNPDVDGDGVPNRLDLDSDNDGIPDNIEAQTTLGYAAPSSDNNNNGLADNYEGATLGLTPVDTDNDGTPDYLDTDSDNDDTPDYQETGGGYGNDVGINGLSASRETADDYLDVNGTYSDTPANDFTDEDNDVNTGGDVDFRDEFSDTDRDAQSNTVDLDNDNDGVLDSDECANSQAELTLKLTDADGSITNSADNGGGTLETTLTATGGSGAPNTHGTVEINFRAQVINPDNSKLGPCILTFELGEFDDGVRLNIGSNTVFNFNQIHWDQVCEFAPGELFDSDGGPPSGNVGWTPWNGEGNPVLIVTSNSIKLMVDTNIPGERRDIIPYLDKMEGTGSDAFIYKTDDFTCADSNGTGFTLFNANRNTATKLRNVKATARVYACGDTDGDGVVNMLDLDSDNDGIYDVVESGSGAAHTDGVVNGSTTLRGIPQAIDSNDDGVADYTLTNSDGTGLPDFLTLDADGDGCNDVIEAGFGDLDGDGIIGSTAPTVDLLGRVLNQGGYLLPRDYDTNGTSDFQQTGTSPTVTVVGPTDNICNGTNIQLSLNNTKSHFTYQWQVSSDGTAFTDLTDDSRYQGSQRDTLFITNISTDIDGLFFRATIVDSSFVCNTNTSDSLLLTVLTGVNAGQDGTIEICDISQPVNLFSALGDTYDTDGSWINTTDASIDISDPAAVRFDQHPIQPYEFTYVVPSQSACPSDSATVLVSYDLICFPVTAVDDDVSVSEDQTGEFDVLANDSNPLGNPLTITLITLPQHGNSSVSSTNTILYSPNQDFHGTDSLVYVVCDQTNISVCDTATVIIEVSPVNDAPIAVADSFAIERGESFTAQVATNDYDVDNDQLGEIRLLVGPAHGTIEMDSQGKFVYVSDGSATQVDQFTYEVCDVQEASLCSQTTVSITIIPGSLIVSEGFSPNGDGINDQWYIRGIEAYPENSVVVFDRWGSLIYKAQGYDNTARFWDGSSTNGMVPAGTYFYKITIAPDAPVISGYLVIQ